MSKLSNKCSGTLPTNDINTCEDDGFEVLETSNITKAIRNFNMTVEKTENSSGIYNQNLEEWKPLDMTTYQSFFDTDGRLIKESLFREAVFNNGCSDNVRMDAWKFLFGMFPMQSTVIERKQLHVALHYKYEALKVLCKTLLTKEKNNCKSNNFMDIELPIYTSGPNKVVSEEAQLLAKIYASGLDYDLNSVDGWLNVLEKDVPRTDRDHPYFKCSKNLQKLRNILKTYSFFHPSVGYVQGMNDLLTRFLVVLDSEVDAYWCFTWHMERVENGFKSDGMLEEIKNVECLLDEIEPDLYRHLKDCQMQDIIFCHRWLLLSFKREFSYSDSIRYFEIIMSRHFGLDTLLGGTVRDLKYQEELFKSKGAVTFSKDEIESNNSVLNTWYRFEIFVCVAVISLYKEEFFACTDAAEVSHVACHLMGVLSLREVLNKSKEVFMAYCEKCVKENVEPKKDIGFFNFTSFTKLLPSFKF